MKPETNEALTRIKESEKNLIVIVGKNMSGKTSIIEDFQSSPEEETLNIYVGRTVIHTKVRSRKKSSLGKGFRLEKIVECLKEICDDDKWSLDTIQGSIGSFLGDKLSLTSAEDSEKKHRLSVSYNDRKTVEFKELSTGFQRLLVFLMLFETAFFIKNKYEKIVFLIDEIELGLHPEWQRKLLNYFCENLNTSWVDRNIQLIYAAHSEHLIPSHLLDNIYISSYDKDAIKLSTVYELLEHTHDKKLFNVLAPIEEAIGLQASFNIASTLFVEGEEEMSLLRDVLEIHKAIPQLHKIVCLHGATNVGPFLHISSFHLKKMNSVNSVFLLDSDLPPSKLQKGIPNNKNNSIKELQDRFIFLGKNMGRFDDIYKWNEGTNPTFKRKDGKQELYLSKNGECLEDFIIEQIYKKEGVDKPYEEIILFMSKCFEEKCVEDESLSEYYECSVNNLINNKGKSSSKGKEELTFKGICRKLFVKKCSNGPSDREKNNRVKRARNKFLMFLKDKFIQKIRDDMERDHVAREKIKKAFDPLLREIKEKLEQPTKKNKS